MYTLFCVEIVKKNQEKPTKINPNKNRFTYK